MDCSIAPLTEPDMRTTHPALWIGPSKCQLKLGRYLRGVRACSHHVNSQPTALKKFRHSCGLNIWQTSPIAFQTSSKVLAPALLR